MLARDPFESLDVEVAMLLQVGMQKVRDVSKHIQVSSV